MRGIIFYCENTRNNTKLELNCEELAKFTSAILESAGLSGKNRAIAMNNVIKKFTGYDLLAASGLDLGTLTVVPEEDLFTTEDLAKKFGKSVDEINEALEKLGLQKKVNGQYLLTEQGKKYGTYKE